MAQNVQNVTLSLTLPISCQICLGKVRQPVICGNYHVFCSSCIDVWLKKASQCPTCRISITPDNPCRRIIGATNESTCNDSQAIKKHLRKTRSEMLLKEYEDEIEALQKENEELKTKNSSIEKELNNLLDPSSLSGCPKTQEANENGQDTRIDPQVLEEWTSKLRAATDISEKVKLDMERLKEANKTLRAQNMDLVRENLRLKAEIENRSPQKFGRYTVAAMEAKVNQYERDLLHLRRALERSDKYIEELETQALDSQKTMRTKEASQHLCEVTDIDQTEAGEDSIACFTMKEQKRIVTMRRSLSAMEEASVRTDLDKQADDLSSSCGFLLTTSSKPSMSVTFCPERKSCEDTTPEKGKEGSFQHRSIPSTPSSSFSCLSLKSPSPHCMKRTGFRPLSYLRKLSFDDCSSGPTSGNESSDKPSAGRSMSGDHYSLDGPGKPVFWGACHFKPNDPSLICPSQTEEHPKTEHHEGETKLPRTSEVKVEFETHQMSSEDSMNAAYLDKVSELDTMISECENRKGSRCHLTSAETSAFNISLVPEMVVNAELMGNLCAGPEGKPTKERYADSCSQWSSVGVHDRKPVSESGESPPKMKPRFLSSVDEDTLVVAPSVDQGPSHTNKMICNPHGSPGMKSSDLSAMAEIHPDCSGSSPLFMNCVEYGSVQDTENNMNSCQPSKRKKHSTFNAASPSKISKMY